MKHFKTVTVTKAAGQDNGDHVSGILSTIFSFVLELDREKGKTVTT